MSLFPSFLRFASPILIFSLCFASNNDFRLNNSLHFNSPKRISNIVLSRIDRVTMNFTNINTVPGYTERLQPLDVYAVNHNVLRIMSGMGGLAYSN